MRNKFQDFNNLTRYGIELENKAKYRLMRTDHVGRVMSRCSSLQALQPSSGSPLLSGVNSPAALSTFSLAWFVFFQVAFFMFFTFDIFTSIGRGFACFLSCPGLSGSDKRVYFRDEKVLLR